MQPIHLLLLTAVVPEAKALLRGLRLTKVAAPVPFWRGTWAGPEQGGGKGGGAGAGGGGGVPIALAVVGIRACRLTPLNEWLGDTCIEGVIMAGLAGGLAPDLRVGDVVVDPQNAPVSVTHARIAPLHTTDTLVATAREKRELFASTNCAAVDMETAIVRPWARGRGLPLLAIRAISDAAGEPLDPRLLSLVDPAGHVRAGRAIATLAQNPLALVSMLRLQRNSGLAMTNLARVLDQVIASGWPAKNTEGASLPDALSGATSGNRPANCEQ